MFPEHIARILDAFGVPPDTKAALYDLYVSLGADVLEVFGDIAEGIPSPSMLRPEDTWPIRARVVERYLRRNHPQWLDGQPTPSLWHPREAEGRAAGLAVPLGALTKAVRDVVGPDQPLPAGVLVMGRNAHYGGRAETISFDVVAEELDDAIAIALAEGQQHTIPGSVGETSGTFDSEKLVALLWEVQPNVYKPEGERNRAIAKIYRKHRNWHLLTLAAAIDWLEARNVATFLVRGDALAATHEVNPAKPVSAEIAAMHDRTVSRVIEARGLVLTDPTDLDEIALLDSAVMNTALRKHVLQQGAATAIWKVSKPH